MLYNIIMQQSRSWYTNNSDNTSPDAVHQILAFGTLEEALSLKKKIGENRLKEIFSKYPKKIYTPPSLNFIKKFIVGTSTPFDEQKYLKNTPRHLG